MSSWDGGQSVSHVLQWNTNAPDFNASSNSSWLNGTVWSWSFGHTISNSLRSLMSLLLLANFPIYRIALGCVAGRLIENPAARAIRRCACPISLVILNGSSVRPFKLVTIDVTCTRY